MHIDSAQQGTFNNPIGLADCLEPHEIKQEDIELDLPVTRPLQNTPFEIPAPPGLNHPFAASMIPLLQPPLERLPPNNPPPRKIG